jgi:hypothetical protein
MGMNKNTVLGWATFYNDSNGIILIGLGAFKYRDVLLGFCKLVLDFGKRMGFSSLKGRL